MAPDNRFKTFPEPPSVKGSAVDTPKAHLIDDDELDSMIAQAEELQTKVHESDKDD